MYNHVTLIGRITRDLELRKTNSNTSTLSFDLACKNSTKQDATPDYIRCVAFGQSADFLHTYSGKGDLIFLEGSIRNRNYDDSDGKKVYVTEVYCSAVKILAKKKQDESHINAEIENNLDDGDEYISDRKLFD